MQRDFNRNYVNADIWPLRASQNCIVYFYFVSTAQSLNLDVNFARRLKSPVIKYKLCTGILCFIQS